MSIRLISVLTIAEQHGGSFICDQLEKGVRAIFSIPQ